MSSFHVIPVNDLIKHDTTYALDELCVCGPEIELAASEQEGDRWLVIHHSLDGRELNET